MALGTLQTHLLICTLTFCGILGLVFAAPAIDEAQAKILKFENESDGKGNYNFSFETSNGILRRESGIVINEGEANQRILVQGFISFTDPDGKKEEFRYVADENGYIILPALQEGVTFALPPHTVATLLG